IRSRAVACTIAWPDRAGPGLWRADAVRMPPHWPSARAPEAQNHPALCNHWDVEESIDPIRKHLRVRARFENHSERRTSALLLPPAREDRLAQRRHLRSRFVTP